MKLKAYFFAVMPCSKEALNVILHIGGDNFVSMASIEMILDYENVMKDAATCSFFEHISKDGKKFYVENKCKSVVITNVDGEREIYFSPISGATLLKRSKETF